MNHCYMLRVIVFTSVLGIVMKLYYVSVKVTKLLNCFIKANGDVQNYPYLMNIYISVYICLIEYPSKYLKYNYKYKC